MRNHRGRHSTEYYSSLEWYLLHGKTVLEWVETEHSGWTIAAAMIGAELVLIGLVGAWFLGII